MSKAGFDPALKTLVEINPADWVALVGLDPAPVRVIDADVAAISGAADKVLRVEASAPFLLHLEFQSGHDGAALPRKMDLRSVLLEERHDLPVRSVGILLRPEAYSPQLNGQRRQGFSGQEAYRTFRYDVLSVWKLPVEALLAGGLGTLPLAPIGKVTEAELPDVIERMKQRLSRRDARKQADELWTATMLLMGLRYSAEMVEHLLRGVKAMKESTTYQAIKEEGREEGTLISLRGIIILQGERKFGQIPIMIRAEIEKITDPAKLQQLALGLFEANSWQELVPTATKKRSRRAAD